MLLTRRALIGSLAAASATSLASRPGFSQPAFLTKPIPSSGEALPLVGLGSSVTFNVGDDPAARDACTEVIGAFFEAGGRVIDSSPMYGSSQDVIGYSLAKLGEPSRLFSADKVWIGSGDDGPEQIAESEKRWGVARFDLLQVHNLVAWQEHLETLFAMKEADRLRYVGITTSHGRRHRALEEIMQREPLDFVQLTYNVLDREAEERLLPLAQDKGMAVIANRPFQRKALITRVEPHPLPDWAAEFGAANWPQVLLKFIVSHPAITCAIPATSKVAHVRENMGASYGLLPDEAMRRRIVAEVEAL